MSKLTTIQEQLTAIYAEVPAKVQTHYLDRFTESNPEYLSDHETINVKELNTFLVEAAIVERGSEVPYIKINGVDKHAITPDIIAASYPTKPISNSGIVTLINGQAVSAQKHEEDRLLLALKNAILRTKEKIAANVFLTGKYYQEKSGTEVDFGFEVAEKIDAATINNWVNFFFQKIDEYEKENGIYPDRIELGSTLFEKIIKNNEFLEVAKSYSDSIGLSAENKQIYLTLLGQKISKLKSTMDFKGKDINVDNFIYLSSSHALVAGYTALEAVDETGHPYLIQGTEIIDEKPADKETARGKMFGKTGFVPIVALKKLIVRYEITNIEAIRIIDKPVSELEAQANYFLTLSVEKMTEAIANISDKTLLTIMATKETRSTGKNAITTRLGEL